MISLRSIYKRFGEVVAIDDVSAEFAEGEIVSLIGENGAGKSSLMNVLAGLYHPDRGEISIGGRPVRLASPKEAIELGIGMVHQHFMLVPSLTVAENIVLGKEPVGRFGRLDLDQACAQVEETAQRFGFVVDPRARIGDLTVGSQQKVEIVKALFRGAHVLILDEPTAVLTPQEADELFVVTRALAQAGRTVIFISHKLKEVLSISHRILVMRKGRLVGEAKPAQTNAHQLAELMVGASEAAGLERLEAGGNDAPSPSSASGGAAPILELKSIDASGPDGILRLKGVTLEVRPSEIVGIAGVDGNGQRELAEVVAGLLPIQNGELKLGGATLIRPSPAQLRVLGVSMVPDDRLRRGMVAAMTVEENVALGRQREAHFSKGPWIDFGGRRQITRRLIEEFDVRPRDAALRIGGLSGGNQQKVVLARELDRHPKLLVISQPTRGLDFKAVETIHARLRAARDSGTGVLLLSLDLEEVLALADRLYVLYGGQIVAQVPKAEYDERAIGQWMLGAKRSPRPDRREAARG